MSKWKTLSDIRRQYGELTIKQTDAANNPFEQFDRWFNQVLQTEPTDPTAMTLATVDKNNHPDIRVVLLKGIGDDKFIFYSNYHSAKGQQLDHNPQAALNFYWPNLVRQVRIRGTITKISPTESETYFHARPTPSQLSAAASNQSEVIASRAELEQQVASLAKQYKNQTVPYPKHWGGYALKANEFEFWQGRDDRLHDRIHYQLQDDKWQITRLAP